MHDLIVELQLLVIEYLDPRDIVHVQQASSSLHNVVEDYALAVWKLCLWRQCLRNGVFWPIYKDLKTAYEFKTAATCPARFIKEHHEALASAGQGIPFDRVTVIPPGITPDPDLYGYLIPGGRYKLVFEEKRLSMWDLAALNPRNEATQVLAHETKELQELYTVQVVDALRIRVLIRVTDTEWPRPCPPPLEYQVLEITIAGNGYFTVSKSSSLKVAPAWKPWHRLYPTFFHGRVAIPVMQNTVVVWDHIRNEYALSGVTFWGAIPFGLFMNEIHLFYTIKSGVRVIKIGSLVPVPEDTILVFRERALRLGSLPEGSFLCPHGYIASATQGIIAPETLCPESTSDSFSNNVYTFGFIEDTEIHRRIRQYNFTFNPHSPQDSALSLVDLSQDHSRYGYHLPLLEAVRYRGCDGRLATLWLDDTSDANLPALLVSIRTPVRCRDSELSSLVDPSNACTDIQPVHLQWALSPEGTPRNSELSDVQFRPITGKITMLRRSPAGELLVYVDVHTWNWHT